MQVSLETLIERQSDLPELDCDTLTELPSGLIQALKTVHDPRRKQGRRYNLAWMLTIMLCTIMGKHTSYPQMARLAARLKRTSGQHAVPNASTFHRLLKAIDPANLQAALDAWIAGKQPKTASWLAEAISIDGKELRSAKHGGNPRVHLLAACTHDTGMVLGQVDVCVKTNEITRLPVLLAILAKHHDLSNRVITLDALHTQRQSAKLITETYGAHYVFTLKGNQPTLHAQVQDLPWKDVPATDTTIDTSRGRSVIRKLQIATVKDRVLPQWPGLRQIGKLTRTRTINEETSVEVVYVLTSLPSFVAGAAYIADTIRGHWNVENKIHWVRDTTFNEDKNQVRTGFAPRNLAALVNATLNAFRLVGVRSVDETANELHASNRLIRRVLEAV